MKPKPTIVAINRVFYVVLGILFLIFLNHWIIKKKVITVYSPSQRRIESTMSDQSSLESKIPFYQVAAQRQTLIPLSLRRIAPYSLDKETPLVKIVAVLDKVVVAPHHLQALE